MSGSEGSAAVLTVDLDALAANYRLLAARLGAAACAPAVKADAYGLGVAAVAPALWRAGARSFFVATLDEGAALRDLLPDAVVHVLSGPVDEAPADYYGRRLRPVLNSLEQIDRWAADPRAAAAPAALHIDTGMHRLGLSPGETARLAAEPGRLARLTLSLAISHLACADQAGDAMNEAQRLAFLAALDRLGLGGERVCRSLAASSGIFLGPAYHFGMGRPGAALYGLAPLAGQPNPMAQVIRLQGKILQVREIDRGGTVGYGATHRSARQGRLATVGVGYADGLPRSLSNRGCAFFGGHRLPMVGRVSMDLVTLDISDLPAGQAHPGDLVDLIGPGNDVDAVATAAGTIGYELLTRLGRRYRRRYVGRGA
jgi:alanine racemase